MILDHAGLIVIEVAGVVAVGTGERPEQAALVLPRADW
jgi:hypothetical protein